MNSNSNEKVVVKFEGHTSSKPSNQPIKKIFRGTKMTKRTTRPLKRWGV